MIGRRSDARGTATGLAGAVTHDGKLRGHVGSAIQHGIAARRRAAQQTGYTGLALRLSSDRELRRHLRQMAASLRRARNRMQRKSSHRVRNGMLLLGGAGAAAVAFVPQVRRRLLGALGRSDRSSGTWPAGTAPSIATIEEEVVVDVPLATAYNQWTQFEDFPLFMEGVEDVRQLNDTTLHWVASVAGKRAEWDARILHQEPDRKISWESLDGKQTRGTVHFTDAGPSRTAIHLAMSYRPEGIVEKAGSAAGLDRRRVRGDLRRFKELIEARGVESGAWRGEVRGGHTT
jgi:uncharacterized membrane protein